MCSVALELVPAVGGFPALPFALLLSRDLVGFLLGLGGLGKLANLKEFAKVLTAYDILPRRTIMPASYVLPLSEIVIGIGLLLRLLSPVAELSAAGLFLIFGVGISINLLRGRRTFPCGCFGRKSEVLSWHIASRTLAMVGLSLFASGRMTTVSVFLLCPYASSALLRAWHAGPSTIWHKEVMKPPTLDERTLAERFKSNLT